ncbi:MAG: type VI secretion system tube protein Hcp [Bryobacteraceae bacterium]
MASEMYLKFDPEVKGESTKAGYEGWIEVLSAGWGVMNPSTISAGAGAGAGMADFSTLSVMCNMDAATVFLMKKSCEGTHFTKATLEMREAGGASPVVYWKQEMHLVFVDSVQFSGAGGGGKPTVSLSLNVGAVELTYNEQKADGSATKHGPIQWSVKKNNSSTDVS